MTASKSGIVRDPEILGGAPVFCGTRVPLQTLLDYVEGGETLDEFLDDFATVSREAAVLALRETSPKVADKAHFLAAVKAGIDSADRGEFLEHEEVIAKVKRILKS